MTGSIESRLEKLEARFTPQKSPRGSARSWEVYFHVVENARREIHGLEALPPLKYTEEDRSNDLDTLENVLPAYRASAGWREEKDQAALDAWEEQLKESTERNRHD